MLAFFMAKKNKSALNSYRYVIYETRKYAKIKTR